MSELKACPFCGEPPVVGLNGYPRCPIPGIGTHAGGMTVEEWQTRPIEDALQQRVEELEMNISALRSLNKRLIERGNNIARLFEIMDEMKISSKWEVAQKHLAEWKTLIKEIEG